MGTVYSCFKINIILPFFSLFSYEIFDCAAGTCSSLCYPACWIMKDRGPVSEGQGGLEWLVSHSTLVSCSVTAVLSVAGVVLWHLLQISTGFSRN